MLSRRRPLLVSLSALALASIAAASAARGQSQTARPLPTPNPPTVVLESDVQTLSACEGESARVNLRANARSPEGRAITYRWRASGGRIEGDGANVVWDLTGAAPGVYTAGVEVNTGVEGDACMAFTNTPVVIRACAPPRPFCPNVSIYCPDTVAVGAPVTFNAEVTGGTPGVTPTYNWKVSAGTITSGQGTPSITVDTAGVAGQAITATLEVLGYNLTCNAVCTTQVPAPREGTRFDVYPNVNFNNEKARLDNFAVALQNDPNARGYIVVYGSRRGRPDEASRRGERGRAYLTNERGIGSERVVVLTGGPQEQLRVELWIVPAGATPPRPRM